MRKEFKYSLSYWAEFRGNIKNPRVDGLEIGMFLISGLYQKIDSQSKKWL